MVEGYGLNGLGGKGELSSSLYRTSLLLVLYENHGHQKEAFYTPPSSILTSLVQIPL
jgi:hypothetical protein